MSAGALPSAPSPLLCPAGAPVGSPLQHRSLENPETGEERMGTKIRHWGGKECQEEQNWGKKENETLSRLKSTREEREGRSRACESRGFCERVFVSECLPAYASVHLSLADVAAGNFASVFLTYFTAERREGNGDW